MYIKMYIFYIHEHKKRLHSIKKFYRFFTTNIVYLNIFSFADILYIIGTRKLYIYIKLC